MLHWDLQGKLIKNNITILLEFQSLVISWLREVMVLVILIVKYLNNMEKSEKITDVRINNLNFNEERIVYITMIARNIHFRSPYAEVIVLDFTLTGKNQ